MISLYILVIPQSSGQGWCGTDYFNNIMLKENPMLENRYKEDLIRLQNLSEATNQMARQIHIIPVVVHVLHDNGFGNITASQVWDGINVLNEDFRRMNSDTSDTRPVFKPFAADCEFQFKLAEKDTDGNCTNGIVRINTPLTKDADNTVKSLSYWPSDRYFNVWLVNSIAGGNQNSIILGYAQFPNWGSWNTYGVVIRYDQWGRIGTSTADGRTASHEVGHCLGLYHTFQDGCGTNCSNSGDNMCDTPPVNQPTYSCNQSINSCSNDQSGPSPYSSDVPDQIENYMSYDACQNMFTKDQKTRMKTIITAYPQLENLVSPSNLMATGTDGQDILCAADFITPETTVCVGNTVKFYDESYHGQNAWQWSFPGASPAVSTEQHPEVVYYAPGLHDVILSVSNGQSNKTTTKNNYILVLPGPGQYLPFTESFENIIIPDNEWWTENPDNDHTWSLTTDASYSGLKSVMIDNFNKPGGRSDELVSSTYDMSNLIQAVVTFKMAFAKTSLTNNDRLSLYVSGNCGDQWALRWRADSSNLATVSGYYGNLFIPSDSTEWEEISVYFNGSYLSEHSRLKFTFESGGGNRIYIDDINISGTFNPVPVLQSPSNGAVAQDENTLIDWKPVYGIDFYEYRIDTINSFDSPLLTSGIKSFISNVPDSSDSEFLNSGLIHNQKYYWTVRSISGTDTSQWALPWWFKVSESGVGNQELIHAQPQIHIYPNPAAESTYIVINQMEKEKIVVELIDMIGNSSEILYDDVPSGSELKLNVQREERPSGIYVIKVISSNWVSIGKLIFR